MLFPALFEHGLGFDLLLSVAAVGMQAGLAVEFQADIALQPLARRDFPLMRLREINKPLIRLVIDRQGADFINFVQFIDSPL